MAAVLGVCASPAAASHVACGDVITQDTTLDSDLVGCPGPGVVIGAPGITLDLDGHAIAGAQGSQGQYGVDNSAGHDGVTVTHGTITGFFAAVRFAGADDGLLSRLAVVRGQLWLSDSDRNVIERNRVAGAVLLDGDSDDNAVALNHVSDAGNAIFLVDFVSGLPAPERNRVERNLVTDSGFGVAAFGASATTIAGNTITRNYGTGISNRSIGTVIEHNHVTRNGFGSEFQDPTSGISSFNARDTTVRGNHVTRNAVDGIAFGPNTFGHNLVEGNVVQRNGDDGIDVDQQGIAAHFSSAIVARNKAHHNGDLGIEAVPQVTDGGANKAHGNGNPLQCLNVRCR